MKNSELLHPTFLKTIVAIVLAAVGMFIIGYYAGKELSYLFV